MDLKTVFTKTAKGVTQVNQKTQSLSRDLMKVLKAIDGKSNVTAIAERSDFAVPVTEKSLAALQKDGFVKVFEIKQEIPMSDFGGEDDDFDFTAPKKPAPIFDPAATTSFKPSQYRTPASSDQVERATSSAPVYSAPPPPPKRDEALEAALAAAREKAQVDARARAEREAQIRARLEVEARAKREAEQRAIEEAKRAQAAAENARVELESKLAAEKKQRDTLSDTRNRLTREQLEKESEHQRALTAARAQAEAEVLALAQARAKAEAEAKALAAQRVQAEAAAKKQQEELDAAQRDLRHQLKEEIEAKVRAEMQEKLSVEIDEQGRAEVEAAVMAEAREQARGMLEEQLRTERESLARAEAGAKERAEVAAKTMLADQEKRIRAEMAEQFARLTEEKTRVEAEARRMAEAQAEAAAKAAAEMSARLKAEEEARRAAEAESESRKQAEAANRQRLEARARDEAADRARVEAEMNAKLTAEKEAKIQAQAQALIEAEMREKSERESRARFEVERQARAEAEQKVLAEGKAREIASRAAAEQAEARERAEREAEIRLTAERREAEEMLKIERAARAKAEEKARAEEEAEEHQRAAQVARLKELSEQQERNASTGYDAEAEKTVRRHKRNRISPMRWAIGGVISLVVIGLIAIHVVPLGAVNARFEKALGAWMHDDASSANMRISLFPSQYVKLDQVALGKVLDARASSGRAFMDIRTVFSDRFAIETLELSDITITPEALQRASKWADADGRGTGMEIKKLVLKGVKLDIKGLAIEPFDADLTFDKTGKIARAAARARDGKWTLDLSPAKTAGDGAAAPGDWSVDFSSRALVMPFGAPIQVSIVSAKGTLSGDAVTFPNVEFKVFEGSGTGNLRADWKNGFTFNSEFALEKIKVDQLAEVFTRDVALGGRLDGQFTAAASASTLSKLLDAPQIQGTFQVKDGSVGNVDLVQAMRSPGSVGGQSKFTELSGQLRIGEGVIRYEKLKLAGGVLIANGNVSVVGATSVLSGSVNSEIRSSVAQDRANFIVTGKVSRPALKRG